MDENNRPPTPERIKKYRRSTLHEPGKRVTHPGRAEDRVPEGKRFGVETVKPPEEDVGVVMQQEPEAESDFMRERKEQLEQVYKSKRMYPLGQPMRRGYDVPDVRFGVRAGKQGEPNAKDVIFSTDSDPEDGSHQPYNYRILGVSLEPGEQRNRHYDWEKAGIDPRETRFGKVQSKPQGEEDAKSILFSTGNSQEEGAGAKIVRKELQNAQLATRAKLGKPLHLGANDAAVSANPEDLPPSGIKSHQEEQWGVPQLVKGDYTEEEQMPDRDLGRQSVSVVLPEEERNRVFGVPTIRTDVRPPSRTSVANDDNYGNEPGAADVIYPGLGGDKGVDAKDYVQPAPLEDIKALYRDAGCDVDDHTFDAVCREASELDGCQDGYCTLGTFQRLKPRVEANLLGA